MALNFPMIYLFPANLDADEIAEVEAQIPTLTYDPNEAEIFLGKVSQKKRVLMELRKCGFSDVEEVVPNDAEYENAQPSAKRRKISDDGNQQQETQHAASYSDTDDTASTNSASTPQSRNQSTFKVLKLAWLTNSISAQTVLPLKGYLLFEGRKVSHILDTERQRPSSRGHGILDRAKIDAASGKVVPFRRVYGHNHKLSRTSAAPALPQETTAEHDAEEDLPPVPDYLHSTYACQRPTVAHSPNQAFIDELAKIRVIRNLAGDEIGVRSYSTMMAAVAAYPYAITTIHEIARLPGCGPKSAVLYHEFRETGTLTEVAEADANPKIECLKLFYNIYGVGASTARDFYNRGWRDLDDVVDHGWQTLSRVQQIGVKYYDDFQEKIPRFEVESIANLVLEHARRIDKGFEMVIVGGHRRGKLASGDVDVVLSHRDEAMTLGFIGTIVKSLAATRHIKYLLSQTSANSERGQRPVSYKVKSSGSGFDTLDKALVVWQDPRWSTEEDKNPNPHRRVDIIVSPWKTVGCAVLGWTSGTTFQRDMRRYCKTERRLRFDSSGIRSRVDGCWVDLESGPDGAPAPDMLTAERRVFEGLGLEYRAPEERCTG